MTRTSARPVMAVVGIGRWGKNLIREFDSIASIRIACSTGDKKNVRWLKQRYPHIAHTTDNRAVFSDQRINAVVIATPIQTHAALAAAALRAGKHVFVEKPLATSTTQAEQLYALAKKHRRALFVGNTFLYHPVFQALQKRTRGDHVQHIHASWNKFGTFDEDVLWNIAYHDILLALALCGAPENAALLEDAGGVSASDIVSIRLVFAKGQRAHITVNRISPKAAKTMVLVTRTHTFLWEQDTLYMLRRKSNKFVSVFHSRQTPLANECRAFLKKIKAASFLPDDAALNIAAIRTLMRLRRYSPQ